MLLVQQRSEKENGPTVRIDTAPITRQTRVFFFLERPVRFEWPALPFGPLTLNAAAKIISLIGAHWWKSAIQSKCSMVRTQGGQFLIGLTTVFPWQTYSFIFCWIIWFQNIDIDIPGDCSLKKILVHPKKNPKKIPKNPKIFWKIQRFFGGFEIRIPYLGVNNSSNSVFKSFFIYKILVHQKIFSKIPQKLKDFFGEFKIRTPFLGVNIPSWNSIILMP